MNKSVRSKIGALVLSVMALSGAASFADAVAMPVLISEPVPELISEKVDISVGQESTQFVVKQSGDAFTIILDSNPSTGYAWEAKVNKESHVAFLSQDFVSPKTMMPGAGGKETFTYKVLEEGVSTISFKYKRAWEDESIETLEILVYKNADKVFVEEDQIISIDPIESGIHVESKEQVDMTEIMDGAIEIDNENRKVLYKDAEIKGLNTLVEVDGVTMFPLSSTLKALGYDVAWNSENRTVEIKKGAQWTSIKIGENAYFKNRMAARPLSAAPAIIEGATYVPVEFLVEILGLGIQVESGTLILSDYEAVVHAGYVTDIQYDETGTKTITISSEKDSDDYMNMTVVHTSEAYTYYNTEVEVGAFIRIASPMMMTMSLPPQTSGYIVY